MKRIKKGGKIVENMLIKREKGFIILEIGREG
jgi:hypothetical protein